MAYIETAMPKGAAVETSRAFWVIFVPSFAVFLAIALIGQVLGWHWRSCCPGPKA